MCSSVCSKKCSGLWALLKNYMQYSYNQYMWDRGRFSVPYSFPLICRAYLPFKYIPPFLCLSRARGASKNTPRGLSSRCHAKDFIVPGLVGRRTVPCPIVQVGLGTVPCPTLHILLGKRRQLLASASVSYFGLNST